MTRRILTIVAAAVALGVLVVGGYQLGWWLREDAVNRTAEIRRDSFERQETLRDEVIDQADDIARVDVQLTNPTLPDETAAALRGQRTAMVRQLCSLAADITGDTTPTIDRLIAEEC